MLESPRIERVDDQSSETQYHPSLSAGAYPSSHWVKAGYNLNKSPVHYRADIEKQPTTHSHIHIYGQCFGSWEEAVVSEIS